MHERGGRVLCSATPALRWRSPLHCQSSLKEHVFRPIMYLSSARVHLSFRTVLLLFNTCVPTFLFVMYHPRFSHIVFQVLSGHEGPVTSLAFSPKESLLASGSWDHTIKFWDVYKSAAATETIETPSDTLALAFRPDGKEVWSYIYIYIVFRVEGIALFECPCLCCWNKSGQRVRKDDDWWDLTPLVWWGCSVWAFYCFIVVKCGVCADERTLPYIWLCVYTMMKIMM
jgi:hypothetical protein